MRKRFLGATAGPEREARVTYRYHHDTVKRLGPWSLEEALGEGGNARVWRARGDDGAVAAVKVLKAVGGEQYARFRDEVAVLQRLGSRLGILPLIEAHLPERPTRKTPAWMAMPVADSLLEHLGPDRGLDVVVRSVQAIATTLADLADEGIGHRDVKPANMYWFEGGPAIGDFGLAKFPGKQAIIEAAKKLGPHYFLAPEMLRDPANALSGPADVYSLGKSLWVLATGQTYPPPGEQRLDVAPALLSSYVDHPRGNLLDRLIQEATWLDPDRRPSMRTFSAELSSWLAPVTPTGDAQDVSDLAERALRILEKERDEEEAKHRPQALATQVAQRFFDEVSGVGEILESASLPVEVTATTTLWDIYGRGRLEGHGRPLWSGAYMYRVQLRPAGPRLFSGVGTEVYEDEYLHLVATHILLPVGPVTMAEISWVGSCVLPLAAKIQQQSAIADLAAGLRSNIRGAVDHLVQLFEEAKGLP
jgi:serine/threonine protein kinase